MTREIARLEEERDVLADVVPSFGGAFFLPRLVVRFGGDDVTRALSRPTSLTAWLFLWSRLRTGLAFAVKCLLESNTSKRIIQLYVF